MEPLYYVMAILGCGDGVTACQDARVLPARYSTVAQCRAALPQAIAANTDVPYPTIAGACRASAMQVADKGQVGPRS